MALTNPYHHLLYQQFSILRSEIVFGPFILFTGAHSYICFMISFVLLLHFAFKNSSKLYFQQCIMLTLGGLLPMTVRHAGHLLPLEPAHPPPPPWPSP